MESCKIRQANFQNILVQGSSQPTITNSNIREAVGTGMVIYQSNPKITNTLFALNGDYPIKFTESCDTYLKGNTYFSNTPNYIALSGGTYDADRTLYFDNVPYHVLDDIVMAKYANHSRLTVQPGVTMAFDPGVQLQLGWPSSYGGDLWAEGKADSVITFKPYNNLAGGWDGIYFSDWNDGWSGISSLKYCLVEKGASYNIQCINSNQPTIDHSTLTLSTGNGLVINGGNLTVKNSNFTYNAASGIYFDGNATSTVGNTGAFTCNLYNNGAYAIYNNSTSNINARYNFWGPGDSTMVAFRIYDKSDNAAKGRVYIGPFAGVPSLATTTTLLSGTVKYANIAATTIKNAPMVIKDFGGTTVASTTTNTSGVYAFPSFASGNYQMTISPVPPASPWSPCNSTDALNVQNHFAMVAPLTGMNLAAADVNFSHTVNGTDALLILKRFTQMITTFPAGESLWDSDTVIVNGSNATNNILLQYFGDVNATFTPAKKSSSSVGLVYEGSLLTESFAEFDFPVRLKTGMLVGAISLGFYYPEQYLEITGAQLDNGASGFSWTASDGLFLMGWCDLNALNISDDEIVVILKMKAKDLAGLSSGIALEIFEDCEFADGLATPNPLAVVSVPMINTTLTGLPGGSGFIGLTVYPNPVTQKSMIEFSLEAPAKIRVSLLNIVGSPVMNVASGDFAAGNHKVALNASGLKPGIYFLKVETTSGGQTVSDMIKLVVSI